MRRAAIEFKISQPITFGWHMKHILVYGLLTGGLWLFTGYPLCLAGKRRANTRIAGGYAEMGVYR